jgi:hypothetical protein
MTITSGPNFPTGGLNLCLDAANRKSFSGIGVNRVGNIYASFGNWNGLVGTSTAYTTKTGTSGVYLNITAANGGGVNWWNSSNGGPACLASTQYTITALVKYTTGTTPNPNLFYVRQYNSGGAQTSEGGRYNSSNQIYAGDGFYLTWATFTTDATAASFLVQGYDYQNIQIWLEDVQCKLGGLGDISGNTNHGSLTGTMTLSSSNSGVIQFSGNNYITTGLNLSSGAYTVIAAARYTAVTGRIITSLSNNWLMGHWSGSTQNHYAEGWVSAPSAGTGDTNWRILAASGNTSTDSWQMYVNGTQTYSNSDGSAGPNNIGINVYPTERSTGEVGFLLAYNRVLSANEIKQIYYGVRSRYGV